MKPPDRLDELDYYTLLGVDERVAGDGLKVAFHGFALKYHPDRFAGDVPERVERAAEIFRRGAEAYRVLGDVLLRREYDAGLSRGVLRLEAKEENAAHRTPAGKARSASANPKAQGFAAKAARAVEQGDLQSARLNLKIALNHDPDNEALQTGLRDVETRLRTKHRK